MDKIVFACVHNAGRSQMAAAFFNALADRKRAHAISAGTQPGKQIHPEVILAMDEIGIDLRRAQPNLLTRELAEGARFLFTMGCGEACPFIAGATVEDWPLPDPKGRSIEAVREIRDEIQRRITQLINKYGWVS